MSLKMVITTDGNVNLVLLSAKWQNEAQWSQPQNDSNLHFYPASSTPL